jgi:lactoylglutathione lyase
VSKLGDAPVRSTAPDAATEPVPVGGLFETHLTVSDLSRSVAFYRKVVGLPLALEAPERGAAFLWIGEPGAAMLGLWSLGSAPVALSLHVALAASLEHVMTACERLRRLGARPLSFFAREAAEPSVIGWMPAAAVYFRDPDGHLLEYLAMLDESPRPDLGIVAWSEWAARTDTLDADRTVVRFERHTGPRGELRALFEMAEDSGAQLDSYLEAGHLLVAVVDDRIVGHVQLVDAADAQQSEIKNMAVEPSFRGRGIGLGLIRAAVELVRAQRCSTLMVATAAADIGNLRFYQRAGFRIHSIERDAFTQLTGYAPETSVDGIELRDRVWLDLDLDCETR